jgi:hypothetical protein
LQARTTHLGSEAVRHSANLLVAQRLQRGDARDNDGVDGLGRMRVVPTGADGNPVHQVKARRPVEIQLIPVEEINHSGRVSLGGEAVGEQLAVVPDAEDICNVQDGGIFLVLSLGLGEVDICLAVGGLAEPAGRVTPRNWLIL